MTNKIPEPKDLPCPEGYWWVSAGRRHYLYREVLRPKLVFAVVVTKHDHFSIRDPQNPHMELGSIYSTEVLRREVENACARERLLR